MSPPRLLDTSIVSLYIAPRAAEKTPKLLDTVDAVIATDGARISIVTYYELDRGLRKLELRNEGRTKRRYFTMFVSGTTLLGLDASSFRGWDIAAGLHARAATLTPAIVFEDADLLILATALAYDLRLLTADRNLANRAADLGIADGVELVEVS